MLRVTTPIMEMTCEVFNYNFLYFMIFNIKKSLEDSIWKDRALFC